MKIALQIYSLRDAGDADVQLALARRCGFEWIEAVAAPDIEPQALAVQLQRHGVRVASMHASLALLESAQDKVVNTCRATACPLVVMPWLPMGDRPATAAGWQALGARLAAIGASLAGQGLRLAYHNHEFEFLAYEGRPALDWLFDAAAPEQLAWEADLGWVCRAGADPWHWLARHGDRLAAVHAKDIAPDGSAPAEDGWAALGQGIVPWEKLLAHLDSRVDLVIFEHDRPADPERVLRESRQFLARHLG